MNVKKIAFFSTILLLLVGFYYLYEVRYSGKQKDKADSLKKVLNIKTEEIDRIHINKLKDTIGLEKRDKEWFLVKPIIARADNWAVDQIIDTLAKGTWEKEVVPLPEDLDEFGLSDPEIEVELACKGLSESHKVLIGSKNPTGNMRYVRISREERVLLVYDRFKDVVDKTPDDLRDKHILRLKEDDVFKIVWRVEEKTFEAEKKENKWVVVDPAGEEIAESKIRSLVWRLEGLKFKKIYEKPDHPLSYYGLDRPVGMIKLVDQDKQVIKDLSFGLRKEPTVSYYVKTEGGKTVYELSSDFLNDLPKPEEGKEEKQTK